MAITTLELPKLVFAFQRYWDTFWLPEVGANYTDWDNCQRQFKYGMLFSSFKKCSSRIWTFYPKTSVSLQMIIWMLCELVYPFTTSQLENRELFGAVWNTAPNRSRYSKSWKRQQVLHAQLSSKMACTHLCPHLPVCVPSCRPSFIRFAFRAAHTPNQNLAHQWHSNRQQLQSHAYSHVPSCDTV